MVIFQSSATSVTMATGPHCNLLKLFCIFIHQRVNKIWSIKKIGDYAWLPNFDIYIELILKGLTYTPRDYNSCQECLHLVRLHVSCFIPSLEKKKYNLEFRNMSGLEYRISAPTPFPGRDEGGKSLIYIHCTWNRWGPLSILCDTWDSWQPSIGYMLLE